MLSSFLEAVLPGLRDSRRPFVCGLLWILFTWLLLAESIPRAQEATSFVRQVYDLAASAGNGTTIAVVVLLAYVIGILGVTLSEVVGGAVGGLIEVGWRTLRWQSAAQIRLRSLNAELKEANRDREAGNANAKVEQQLEKKIQDLSGKVMGLKEHARLGRWIRSTSTTNKVMGTTSSKVDTNDQWLAETAVQAAWARGVNQELTQRDRDDIDPSVIDSRGQIYDYQIYEQDLGLDPLDTLRALDEGLFQAFDRERAERDFRLAVMPTVLAISLYVGLTVSRWGYIVAVLAVVTFLQAAMRRTQERSRVLNQILLKGLELPALKAAKIAGRSAVRSHIVKLKGEGEKV